MLLLIQHFLLTLSLMPVYKSPSYLALRDGSVAVSFTLDAFIKFQGCVCDVPDATCIISSTVSHVWPQINLKVHQHNDEERHKVLRLFNNCYFNKGTSLTLSGAQIGCNRVFYSPTCAWSWFPRQNRNICLHRCIHMIWDKVNITDKNIHISVTNICQIDCAQGRNPTNKNNIPHFPDQSNNNPSSHALQLMYDMETNQQRLNKNIFLLFGVGISVMIAALICLGLGCYILKRRQRASNNSANAYVSNGRSDRVEFLTSHETSRLSAGRQVHNSKYSIDPTSIPKAPLPPITSDIHISSNVGHYTSGPSQQNKELEDEERDFVNTRVIVNNPPLFHTVGPTDKLTNQRGAKENIPGVYRQVALNQSLQIPCQTAVKFNVPIKTVHRPDDRLFRHRDGLRWEKNLIIVPRTSDLNGRSNESCKIEHDKILVDSNEKKTYAKLHQRIRKRLNDYNTLVKGHNEKSKPESVSEDLATISKSMRGGESRKDQREPHVETDYKNSWIADEVGSVGGFEGFAGFEDIDNMSCSSEDSELYINTTCEDLQHVRRDESLSREPSSHVRSNILCVAVGDNGTVHGKLKTVGYNRGSWLNNECKASDGFVELEDVDDRSCSSVDKDLYLNTDSEELNNIKQRGMRPNINMGSKICDGRVERKTGMSKAPIKGSVDDDGRKRKFTAGNDVDDSSDDYFYFGMSQNVVAKMIPSNRNIETNHFVEMDAFDDIYNTTNMDDSFNTFPKGDGEMDESRSLTSSHAESQSCYNNKNNLMDHCSGSVTYKIGLNCNKQEQEDFNSQDLGIDVNSDHKERVNMYPQQAVINDNNRKFIQRASLYPGQLIETFSEYECQSYDVNNETTFENLDDENSNCYYDVGRFYHRSQSSDVCQREDGVNRNKNILDQRDHGKKHVGELSDRLVKGHNYDLRIARHDNVRGERKDDDEDDDGDGDGDSDEDEYINVGYDNYTESVHDDINNCTDDNIDSTRYNDISKPMSPEIAPPQFNQDSKAGYTNPSLTDQSDRVKNMLPSPFKNSYYQLERDF